MAPETLTLAPPRAEPRAAVSWLIEPSHRAGSVGAWDRGRGMGTGGVGAAGKTTLLSSLAKTFPDKLA